MHVRRKIDRWALGVATTSEHVPPDQSAVRVPPVDPKETSYSLDLGLGSKSGPGLDQIDIILVDFV